MKRITTKFSIMIFFFIILNDVSAQDGTLELEDGITLGNSTSPNDGTIRYNGSDFEGRIAGVWNSLTSGGGASMWNQNGSHIYFDSGNVGVGTNDPAVKLHAEGINEVIRISGVSPWLGIRETGGNNYGYNWMTGGNLKIGVTGANDIGFIVNGSERLRIEDNGNIGIGTTVPGAKLDVRGGAVFNEGSLDVDFRIEGNNDANLLFLNGGNDLIGIGTGAPLAKLHIKDDYEALRLEGTTPFISYYDGSSLNGFLYHNGTNFQLSNEVAGDLNFKTNSATRMTIDESGNVGIGTSSPGAKLDVRGDAVFNEGSSSIDFRIESDYYDHMFFVDGSANAIGINTATPGYELDVDGKIGLGSTEYIEDTGTNVLGINANTAPKWNGLYDLGTPNEKWVDVWAINGTIQTSDKNLKKDIQSMPYGLKEILQLNPVSFKWKDSFNQDTKLGLLAQDIQSIIPEVVKSHYYELAEEGGSDYNKIETENLGVYYSDLIPVLINAIKDQQKIIDSLNDRVVELEAKIN